MAETYSSLLIRILPGHPSTGSFEFSMFILFNDSVILHFYSKQSQSFVYMVNGEVFWLSLCKPHHCVVSYLPTAIKVALLHIDVVVNINAAVDSEITRQKKLIVEGWPSDNPECTFVSVYGSVCLYIKVVEKTENVRLQCFV